ncbi:MAG TPA: outer membrane beta-barrel protein [Gemmatimonadales bacterium]|nr:outer membrane beta-barrel protein [Gemmatimonadales bacterium]
MRTALRLPLIAFAITAIMASSLSAQHRRPGIREAGPDGRSGFWGVLSLGAGVEQVNFEGDDLGYSDPLTRGAGSIRLGGTVSRHVRLGGELGGWVNEDGGLTETVGGAMLIGQFYPGKRSGFFLKAGAGLGFSTLDDNFGTLDEDVGVAGVVGAGWDIRLGRRLFLVPTVDFQAYAFDGGATDYQERITTFGIGIAYQR